MKGHALAKRKVYKLVVYICKLMIYMKNITENEMRFILTVCKNPKRAYNANTLSKVLGISRMGCLKIAKKLEKGKIVRVNPLGRAKFFRVDLRTEYVRNYVSFLLKREAEQAGAYVRVWVHELREKITKAQLIVLFGSVLTKGNEANDIDVLFVTRQNDFEKLKKEVEKINQISPKRVHPVYQSFQDLKENIQKQDPVILNIIRGIVVSGTEAFVEVMQDESYEREG